MPQCLVRSGPARCFGPVGWMGTRANSQNLGCAIYQHSTSVRRRLNSQRETGFGVVTLGWEIPSLLYNRGPTGSEVCMPVKLLMRPDLMYRQPCSLSPKTLGLLLHVTCTCIPVLFKHCVDEFPACCFTVTGIWKEHTASPPVVKGQTSTSPVPDFKTMNKLAAIE